MNYSLPEYGALLFYIALIWWAKVGFENIFKDAERDYFKKHGKKLPGDLS